MNIEEDDSRQGKMNTPTQGVELVVELNSDILKTIHSLQAKLQSFREDSLNERKEHQVINEALLRNMMGGISQRKPTQSTNNSKREPYHKRASRSQEKNKKRNIPLRHQNEIFIVLSVMTLFLLEERNKELMTLLRGSFEK